ncbi:MAG: hypothetical protein JWO80_132 [Bryobacterales bacterium]|nr:hypothetical protein [Bryobacterales bacterium]
MLEILPLTPATDAFFVLEEGSRRKIIALAAGAAERLRIDAVEALRSLPRRGLEIGGILLGEASNSFLVNGVAPVESEHLYGPGYEQSARDRAVFHAQMDELRRIPAGGNVPIGLYRTYTRESGGVNARDAEALRLYFPESDGVLLLVSPKATGRVSISCFYWDRRSLIPCASAAAPHVSSSLLPADSPAMSVDPVVEFPRAAQQRRNPAWDAARWLNEAALAGIAALIVFGAVSLLHHEPASALVKPTARAASRLGARVVSWPDGAQVVWNGKSDPIRGAVGALLSVEDGGSKTDLPISLSELHTGNVFYGVASPRATFVLTVYAADGSEIRESMVARGTTPAPPRRQAKIVRDRGKPTEEQPRTLTLPPPVTAASGSISPKP